MDWLAPVNIYCERASSEFWAEPFNAASNLGFFVTAALLLGPHFRGQKILSIWSLVLSYLLIFVGGGSFLFHTFANAWSHLADTLPILLWMFFYIVFVMKFIFQLPRWLSAVCVIAFMFASSQLTSLQMGILNGSQAYLPTLLVLFLTGWTLWRKGHAVWRDYLWASFVFAAALSFRSLDQAVCASFPVGTHFIWHLLNAILFYILLGAAEQVQDTRSR